MAISLVSATTRPSQWARLYDTNRMTYQFTSTNYAQPNFQYQFVLIYWAYDGTQNNIGSFNLYPNSTGAVEFNPAAIYKNYLSYDYDASKTTQQECIHGAGKFTLSVYEYYGTPPVQKLTGQWTDEVTNLLKAYNGCQQNIPYDYTTLNAAGNFKWVMNTGTTKGQFLTDATEYRLSNSDLGFLYYLADVPNRPTKIRYTIYYMSSGTANPDNLNYLGNGTSLTRDVNGDQTLQQRNPLYNLDGGGGSTPQNPPITIVSAVTYDTSLSYAYVNTLQYYFPMGPYQLINSSILSTYATSWQYYKIDLMNASNVVLNANPFIVYNACKSDKFGKWQLAWLNPHGGFDCYTFDAKTDINYKLAKSTYKKKLTPNPSFSTYEAGERVYNSSVEKEITLRTRSLTQKEAQLLMQLAASPKVYVNTLYTYNGGSYYYGVSYIVSSDPVIYPQKINDKEITLEIKIRPSNDVVIQQD